jgi:hypothetical protein
MASEFTDDQIKKLTELLSLSTAPRATAPSAQIQKARDWLVYGDINQKSVTLGNNNHKTRTAVAKAFKEVGFSIPERTSESDEESDDKATAPEGKGGAVPPPETPAETEPAPPPQEGKPKVEAIEEISAEHDVPYTEVVKLIQKKRRPKNQSEKRALADANQKERGTLPAEKMAKKVKEIKEDNTMKPFDHLKAKKQHVPSPFGSKERSGKVFDDVFNHVAHPKFPKAQKMEYASSNFSKVFDRHFKI